MPLEVLLQQQQTLNLNLQRQLKVQQEQLQSQAAMIQKLQQQLEQLLRKLYGKKTEKQSKKPDEQDEHNNEEKAGDNPLKNVQPGSQISKERNGHRKLPKSLRRERIEYDLPQEQQICSQCDVQLKRMGSSVFEQLEYRPAELFVLEHLRHKYACPCCKMNVVTAGMPNQPIEKGLPGPGLLAEVIISKYQDAMPLYRQERRFARLHYELSRKTLCDWVMHSASLLKPIVLAMKHDALLPSPHIHTDDTTLPIQAVKKTHIGRLWVYVATGIHGPPCTLYDYSKTRSHKVPLKYLTGYQGYVQADAYAGYNKLYETGRMIEVGCWAHARRKFYDITQAVKAPSLADDALNFIGALYCVERKLAPLDTNLQKRFYRRHHAKPLLKQFHHWLKKQKQRVLPKTPIALAIHYTLNHWKALIRYCSEGFLNIDNNTAERAIKPLVIGRKNYLFAGSHEGAEAAAVIYSIIETCKQCDINPYEYLKDILKKLPNTLNKELHTLLPYHWKPG